MKRIPILLLLLAALPAAAGQVIVNQGMSIEDTFALRDKLAREHEWQEWLRFQQAIKWLEVLPVNCELMSQPGGGYRCGSNHYRPYQQDGREIYIQGDPAGVAANSGEQAAGQRTDQDGDEGPALNQTVAADQFILGEVLRQDRVFDRAEQRRVQAEQEQRAEQHGQTVHEKPERRDDHDQHLDQLDQARQPGLVELVGELTGSRREKEKGQDENSGGEIGQDLGRQRRPPRRLKSEQDDQRVFEQIVVERAEKLRDEERRETARPE